MNGDEEAEAIALAREALHDLIESTGLQAALVKASSVAALRGDVEDRAWFQFQTSDLGKEGNTEMTDDFFRLRRNIDVAGDRMAQRRIFKKAKDDFLDSRTQPDDPSTIFRASIGQLDEILEKFDLYERSADGRELDPTLVARMAFVRTVRQRVMERTERYLRNVIAT